MQLQREDIESIVSEVLKKLVTGAPAAAADARGDWGSSSGSKTPSRRPLRPTNAWTPSPCASAWWT